MAEEKDDVLVEEALKSAGDVVDKSTKVYLEFEHQLKKDFRSIGHTGQQLHNIHKQLLEDSQNWGAHLGISRKELAAMQYEMVKATKTAAQYSETTRVNFAALSKVLGQGTVGKFTEKMGEFGMHAKSANAWIGKGVVQAKALGLNAQMFTESMSESVGLMRKMNFQTGITGLQKMNALAMRLGTSVQAMTKHIDISGGKFSTIEGSIEAAANLQRLGGSWAANFGNPLEVMAEGMFDAEASGERLANTLKGTSTFDRSTGMADTSWFEKQKMLAADKAGIASYDELVKMSQRLAMGTEIEKDFRKNKNASKFTSEQLDAIKNLAEFDADKNAFTITYTDKHGYTQTHNIEDLTTKQLSEAIALTKEEANINRNVSVIAGHVKDIANVMVTGASQTSSITEFLQATADSATSWFTDKFAPDGLMEKARNGIQGWLFGGDLHNTGGTVNPSPSGIEGVPKFNDGGFLGDLSIIPGNKTQGDKVLTRVNSGEMILNKEQQAKLFNLLNGKFSLTPKFKDGGIAGTSPSTSVKKIPKFVDGGIVSSLTPDPSTLAMLGFMTGTKMGRKMTGKAISTFTGLDPAYMLRKLRQTRRLGVSMAGGLGTGGKGFVKSMIDPRSLFGRVVSRGIRKYGGETGRRISDNLSTVRGKVGKVYNNKFSRGLRSTKRFLKDNFKAERKQVISDIKSFVGYFKKGGKDIEKTTKNLNESLKNTTKSTDNFSKAASNAASKGSVAPRVDLGNKAPVLRSSITETRVPLGNNAPVLSSATATPVTPNTATATATTSAKAKTATETSSSVPKSSRKVPRAKGAKIGKVAGKAGAALLVAQMGSQLFGIGQDTKVGKVLNSDAATYGGMALSGIASGGKAGIKQLSNIKNVGKAAKSLGTAKGLAKAGKTIGKGFKGGGALLAAGFAALDIYSSVKDYQAQKEEIENDASLPEGIKKKRLKDAENERNKGVGGAIGSGVGSVIGGALGSVLGPIGTVAGSMAGAWLGDKVGNFVGKNWNNIKDGLFGKEVELTDEEQNQLDYEEHKMGEISIEDPQLMEHAAVATVAMHDLLISIWHHMNGKASNGEEQKEGLISKAGNVMGTLVKGSVSLLTSPFSLVGSLFGGSGDKKGGISGKVKKEEVNGTDLDAQLMEDAADATIAIYDLLSGTEPLISSAEDMATAIQPMPLGEERLEINKTMEPGYANTSVNYTTTKNVNINVGGTIRLDAGMGNAKDIDIEKLLDTPEGRDMILDIVYKGLNERGNGGRFDQNNSWFVTKGAFG